MRFQVCFFTVAVGLLVLICSCTRDNLAQVDARQTTPTETEASVTPTVGLISIVQLLANPQQFNGKRIQVVGFVHFEFEGNAIYLSKEDYDFGIEKNGLWLSFSEGDLGDLKEINNSYAVVEGTFVAEMKGHVGMWSGAIEKITLIKRWARVRKSR